MARAPGGFLEAWRLVDVFALLTEREGGYPHTEDVESKQKIQYWEAVLRAALGDILTKLTFLKRCVSGRSECRGQQHCNSIDWEELTTFAA